MQHKHVTGDKQFWLHDGRVLQTLHQLEENLLDMKKDVFKHHVNATKNDFANWADELYGDKALTNAIRKAKTPKVMASVISKALANAEMEKIEDTDHLKHIANHIRQDLIKTLLEAGSGHSAGSRHDRCLYRTVL